jgi:hypothetical protein
MDAVISHTDSFGSERQPMSRFKAAAIHLLISAGIAGGVLILMLTLWYPKPFFQAAGASQLLYLLVGVDVVIGPLITLVIFNTKKKSLKFDLVVVAALQLCAFLYGMNILFEARPAFIVFAKDHFELVPANEIHASNLKKVTRQEFKSLPLAGPKVVVAIAPNDRSEAESVAIAEQLGLGLQNFPQHYVPYAERVQDAVAAAKPIAKLIKANPAAKTAVDQVLARTSSKEEDVLYLPLRSRTANMTVLLKAKSGEIVDVLPISS